MSLCNRVTPQGDIVAHRARGTLMGNRGIIHDPRSRTLLTRRWQHQAWICCVLEYKDFQHPIMGVGRYTELFFLDEATALAAGHRPCALCRRPDFLRFKAAWAGATGAALETVRAPGIDRRLHAERVTRNRRKVTFHASIGALPDGTMVLDDGVPRLVLGSKLARWTASGYDDARPRPATGAVEVLTPRTVVAVLARGFRPRLHPSAAGP